MYGPKGGTVPDSIKPKKPTGWIGPLASLGIRNYRWLWLGIFFFFNGMQMQMVAGGWLVYTMTNSATALGLVSAGWGLPMLVFSLYGGAMADRVMRKRDMLLITQIGIFITSLIITFLVVTGRIQLWHLVASSFLFGFVFSFAMPARQAFIVELVGEGDLLNAVALSSGAMNICRVASPALAGFLIKYIDIPGVYILITISYGLVGLTTLMIPRGENISIKPDVPVFEDLKKGLAYVKSNKTIMMLLSIVFVPILVAMPYQMLMPVFARTVYNAGETGLGLLMSGVGGGALIGSFIIASLGNFKHKGLLMMICGFIFAIGLIAFGLAPSLITAFAILLFMGAGSSMFMTLTSTLLMTNTPPELIGRVMSLFMMTWGLMPLGVLPAAALADVIGAPYTVMIGGGIFLFFITYVVVKQPAITKLN